MPNQQLPETSQVRSDEVKSSLSGVLTGIIFVVFILFLLNYFDIVSFPFFPHLSIGSKIVETNSFKNNPNLAVKAKNAGYSIIWQGNPNDTNGRTIITDGRNGNNSSNDKTILDNTAKEKLLTSPQLIGVLKNIEPIPKTKDFYLVLVNPITKFEFKTRVIIDVSKLSAAVESTGIDPSNRTHFTIENLSYGPKDTSQPQFEGQNLIASLSKDKLADLIKPGDIIVVTPIQVAINGALFARTDSNKVPAVLNVIIRRFL